MKVLFVNSVSLITQFFSPFRSQCLGHDVFDSRISTLHLLLARRIICSMSSNSLTQTFCALHRDVLRSISEYEKAEQLLSVPYHDILIIANIIKHRGQFCFTVSTFLLHIFFPMEVKIVKFYRAQKVVRDSYIISQEHRWRIIGRHLYLMPIFLIALFLIDRRKRHEKIVSYFISFFKSQTCGVKAFKYQLRFIVVIKVYADYLKPVYYVK